MTSVSSTTAAATAASLTGSAQSMGKDDFLKLLVAQLQHQDPLNPADPTEFTSQLSEFSSLEQLFSVNEQLGRLAGNQGDLERLSALSLIGREVVSQGGSFRLEGSPVSLGYRLEQPASEVQLQVRDLSGRLVAALPAPSLGAGEHFLSWDGRDASGRPLPIGDYALTVSARSGETTLSAASLVRGVVTGVDLAAAGSRLLTSAGSFGVADVATVRSLP